MVCEKTYQNTMSAKHILNTSTAVLEFTDDFYEYFMVEDGYRIRLRSDLEMPDNFIMKINIHEISKDQDIQDLEDNEYVMGFKIYNKEEENEIQIDEKNRNPIYLSSSLFKIIVDKRKKREYDENGWVSIPLESLEVDEDLMYARLENDEITKSLDAEKSLIEKGKEIEGVKNISDLINKLTTLLKNGGVYSESVHIEILVRNLIRDKDDMTKLPDYSKPNPKYIITSIHNSIFNSDSVITSFTFERIHNQLSSPITYKKRGTSPLDRLFILD